VSGISISISIPAGSSLYPAASLTAYCIGIS
jgi:hypothetical protein